MWASEIPHLIIQCTYAQLLNECHPKSKKKSKQALEAKVEAESMLFPDLKAQPG